MDLKKLIKAEAQRQGFTLSGVTSPDPPPHFAVFEAWLRAGRHAEMSYLAAERSVQRRADPRLVLPECRSILVLGMRYAAPALHVVEQGLEEGHGDLSGRIAAYAWGEDYHDVLPRRLQALVAIIESHLGHPVPNRCYTDTGPLMERDLAQRAGLGWIGKNTCLIHPHTGSYFLLAEILLDVDLEPDPPFSADHCGSCTRCLEACPTGCILPDRTLDAAHCLSYLTIEYKGVVPVELRPRLGEWIFGCDICQQVCPWNRHFADSEGDPAFAAQPGWLRSGLSAELELTPEAFNHKFKHSPLRRAKRRGYLRNVAVALGNGNDPKALQALVWALKNEPEALVRGHAAWSLGQIKDKSARQALESAALMEREPWVLAEIQQALLKSL